MGYYPFFFFNKSFTVYIYCLPVQSNKMICFFRTITDLHTKSHIPVVLMNYWPSTCERNLTLSSPFTGEIFYK